MDNILSLINEYRIILGALLLLILTIVAIYYWWESVSLWWLDLTCSLPLIGKNNAFSKRTGMDSQTKWFHGEKNLCEAYAQHYAKADLDPSFFDNCQSYLRKTTEVGRNTLPLIGAVGLAVMVFLEAMGFSYVLAGWTIPGASEHLKQQGAVGIALLVSTILVFLTHHTGHELHHNSLIKKVNVWWESDSEGMDKQPNTDVSLENDAVDNHDAPWRQLLSRIPHNAHVLPSHKITVATVIAIILIGSGATYVRGQVLEQQMAAQHRLENSTGGSPYDNADDPYAQSVPQELQDAQKNVDSKVDDAVESAERRGGWMTFIVLAVIFVFLQFIGIIVGFKTGFAGNESKAARKFIGRFKTRDEFANYYKRKRDRIVRLTDKHLGHVQSRMAARPGVDREKKLRLDDSGSRHFLAYIDGRADTEHEHSADSQPSSKAESQPQVRPSTSSTAHTDNQEIHVDESEIQEWMTRLGWDRERTTQRLIAAKKQQLAAQEPAALSEEEADRLLAEQLGNP